MTLSHTKGESLNLKLQRARYADFKSREHFSPESVCCHDGEHSRYIPIHPFADELATLERLKISPDSCLFVDAWWTISDDATLVQVYTSVSFPERSPGLYARRTDNELGHVYLSAVIECDFITRNIFETTLSRFSELGFPLDSRFTSIPNGGSIKLPEVGDA